MTHTPDYARGDAYERAVQNAGYEYGRIRPLHHDLGHVRACYSYNASRILRLNSISLKGLDMK